MLLIDYDDLDLILYISILSLISLFFLHDALLATTIDAVSARVQGIPTRWIGLWFSAAVASDGSYDVPEGLIFGYPLRTENGKVEIVQDLELNDYAKAKIEITTNELLEEKEEVKDLIA